MHEHEISRHTHSHGETLDVSHGERRTRWVVLLTASMMLAELAIGWWTGSMALLADGWHMATHAGAIGLALLAYRFARAQAANPAFSFGTGKVYALAGYTSGVALGIVALWMGAESIARIVDRGHVNFGDALPIAVLGLAVNLVCAYLLHHDHHDAHDDDDSHHGAGGHADHHHDHNLRAAYIHVLADALTSVLAIVALLAGRHLGWWFLDPVMGIVGGIVIMRWSIELCRRAGRQLLDLVPSRDLADRIREQLEAIDDVRVADLHVWELGPKRQGCIVSLVTSTPRDTEHYRSIVLENAPVSHLTIEVQRCVHDHAVPII